jgi:phage-related protein
MKKVAARFFATTNGREPVREWLRSFSSEDRKVLGTDLQRLEFGWPLGLPICRQLMAGLWELRSNLSGGRTARLIFHVRNEELILLHGFLKKTEKTPASELQLAQSRLRALLKDED